MPHVNRQRRKANERRRQVTADKQKPLPLAEQRERAEARADAHRKAYSVPPNYRHAHDAKRPAQPRCYWTDRELILGHEED